MQPALLSLLGLVIMVLGYVIIGAKASALVGDVNHDGTVNVFDLSILLSDWGTNNAQADINGNGTVDVFDLSILLSHWGQTGSSGTPEVRSGVSGMCLNNDQNLTADGNKVDVATCDGTAGQQWVMQSDGTIQIDGKCLSVDGNKTTSTFVQLWTCAASTGQVWTYNSTNHTLVNPNSSLCLDDPNSSTTSGTGADIATCNGSAGQQWYFDFFGSSGSTTPTPTSNPTPTPTPSPTTAPTPLGVSGNWSLTFDDEFNGSSVDTSKWTVEGPRPPNNDQEYACYSPAAVSEGGGSLNMALLNQSCSAGGNTYQYTGAQMDTTSHFTQLHGYYEARIWSDGTNGVVDNWGAWWLVGTQWPQQGEVDIFEGFHGSAGYHFEYAPNGTAIWQGSQASGDYTGWHTYGVNWQSNALTFYYDGQEMGSFTTGVPTVALHLMLDLATGPQNDVGGPVKVPSSQKVDYVRVWK